MIQLHCKQDHRRGSISRTKCHPWVQVEMFREPLYRSLACGESDQVEISQRSLALTAYEVALFFVVQQ